MENEKWAAEKARQVRERREKEDTQNKITLLHEEQKKDSAKRLWQEFRVSVEAKVKAFNSELGESAITAENTEVNEIRIASPGNARAMSAKFNFVSFALSFMLVDGGGEYHLHVVGGKVVFIEGHGGDRISGAALSPADVAERFLNCLIDGMR